MKLREQKEEEERMKKLFKPHINKQKKKRSISRGKTTQQSASTSNYQNQFNYGI